MRDRQDKSVLRSGVCNERRCRRRRTHARTQGFRSVFSFLVRGKNGTACLSNPMHARGDKNNVFGGHACMRHLVQALPPPRSPDVDDGTHKQTNASAAPTTIKRPQVASERRNSPRFVPEGGC